MKRDDPELEPVISSRTDVPESIRDTVRKLKSTLSELDRQVGDKHCDFLHRLCREYCALLAYLLRNIYDLSIDGKYDYRAVTDQVRDMLRGLPDWIYEDLERRFSRKGLGASWLPRGTARA